MNNENEFNREGERNKKCCWSECENKSDIGVGINSSKGVLYMCNECMAKWSEHLSARERMLIDSRNIKSTHYGEEK